jgi:hypothetical protein
MHDFLLLLCGAMLGLLALDVALFLADRKRDKWRK